MIALCKEAGVLSSQSCVTKNVASIQEASLRPLCHEHSTVKSVENGVVTLFCRNCHYTLSYLEGTL